jgi:hypothetical protein
MRLLQKLKLKRLLQKPKLKRLLQKPKRPGTLRKERPLMPKRPLTKGKSLKKRKHDRPAAGVNCQTPPTIASFRPNDP